MRIRAKTVRHLQSIKRSHREFLENGKCGGCMDRNLYFEGFDCLCHILDRITMQFIHFIEKFVVGMEIRLSVSELSDCILRKFRKESDVLE